MPIRWSGIGTTRFVIIVGPFAMKIGRGVHGKRCNVYEHELYNRVDDRRRAMLCPIFWCSCNGRILIAKAAAPLSEADHIDLLNRDAFPDWDYMPGEDSEPFEYKASDWGRLKSGRLVALDYSTPAHMTASELAELTRAALWPGGD